MLSGRHVAQHRESLYVGYRYYDAAGKAVRYPFGHGLSYARFAYSGLSVQRAGEQLVVRCLIENVGSMTAAETVQLYLAPPRKVAFASAADPDGVCPAYPCAGRRRRKLPSLLRGGMFPITVPPGSVGRWRAAFMNCAWAHPAGISACARQSNGRGTMFARRMRRIGRPVPTMPRWTAFFQKRNLSVFWVGRFHATGRRRKESIRSIPCRKSWHPAALDARCFAVFGAFCVGAAGGMCAERRGPGRW